MHALTSLLWPDRRTALLFGAFSAIALGGFVQSWGFTGAPSPFPLASALLAPLPLWDLWLSLLVPLALASALLRIVHIDLLSGPVWLFAAANAAYFYLLARILAGRLPRRHAGA